MTSSSMAPKTSGISWVRKQQGQRHDYNGNMAMVTTILAGPPIHRLSRFLAPRYWEVTTAPPVPRAAKILISNMLIISTETRRKPPPLPHRYHHHIRRTHGQRQGCSTTSGRISLLNPHWKNITMLSSLFLLGLFTPRFFVPIFRAQPFHFPFPMAARLQLCISITIPAKASQGPLQNPPHGPRRLFPVLPLPP